ncbi:hypothetical protein HR060_14480 [Catenovulum sp. SM1970]|uniref:hypothetical protein n=1 Tax=Marinifaba aquimaris TaxID=2741323 RepID=UPI0015740111|nr:hypothetical protein [Marinifaba aquimaris]NTS78063.1 hypothetical protein [Marinifaba aquimaris]
MQTWQDLMLKGNDCFNESNWQDAELYYQSVINMLDDQLRIEPKCVEAIQGWICGYQNLSTLFAQQGRLELAQKCLLIPHHSMLYMAKDASGDPDRQVIAMQALKITLMPLIEFAQKYPTCNSCYDDLIEQYQLLYVPSQHLH